MDATTPVLLTVLGLLIVLFFWLVNRQFAVDQRVKLYEKRMHLLKNEISVLNDEPNLYYDGIDYLDDKHPYTSDLDVFGKQSLYHRINRANTFDGSSHLKSWLSNIPSNKLEVLCRQSAIQELESKHNFRLSLQEGLYHYSDQSQHDVFAAIQRLMSIDLSSMTTKLLQWYVKLVPALWAVIIILHLIDMELTNRLAIGLFIFNLLLIGRYAKRINGIQSILSKVSSTLKGYEEVSHAIINTLFQDEYLQSCTAIFHKSSAIYDLQKISGHLDYRLNLLAGPVLNGLLLWDLRMVHQMAAWNSTSFFKEPSWLMCFTT